MRVVKVSGTRTEIVYGSNTFDTLYILKVRHEHKGMWYTN